MGCLNSYSIIRKNCNLSGEYFAQGCLCCGMQPISQDVGGELDIFVHYFTQRMNFWSFQVTKHIHSKAQHSRLATSPSSTTFLRYTRTGTAQSIQTCDWFKLGSRKGPDFPYPCHQHSLIHLKWLFLYPGGKGKWSPSWEGFIVCRFSSLYLSIVIGWAISILRNLEKKKSMEIELKGHWKGVG